MDEDCVTEFEWNARHISGSYKQYSSGAFPLKHNDSAKFSLFVDSYLCKRSGWKWDAIQFGIIAKEVDNENPVKLRIQVWLQDVTGSKIGYKHTGECLFEVAGQQLIFGMQNEAEFNFMTEKQSNGSLVLACKLTPIDLIQKPDQLTFIDLTPKPDQSLGQKMWKVYEEDPGFGATIKVEGKQFTVSRTILSAHSVVFHKMLTSNYQEGVSKVIEIEDISASVIEALIKWMFTNEIDGSDVVGGLYFAANKYMIQDLKKHCSMLMCEGLTEDNAAERLALSRDYNDNELKGKILAFIHNKGPDFMETVMSSDVWNDHANMVRSARQSQSFTSQSQSFASQSDQMDLTN